MSSALRIPGASRLRILPGASLAPQAPTEPGAAQSLLARRFAESAWGMPPWMLQARLSDFNRGGAGVPLGVATGTPSDRKGGRDAPLFWSEVDLRGYRVLSRHITDSNPFGKGFSKLLKNYHVRKGFGWQACKKGAKKTPYQTAGAPADPLVAKAQAILDKFRDGTLWPLKSREAFLRWCRDGEVLGRWFYGGTGRLPEFRFGEPDALGSPNGDTEGDESFGVATPPDDPAGPATDYHFFEPDGARGEWVPADRVVFAKRNTDSGVKRGLPDFFPIAAELEDCTKLVRTMLATAIRQAGTAWIEKYPTASAAQVSGAVPEFAPATGYSGQARAPFDSGVPWWLMPQVGGGVNPWEPPGVVRKVEGNREYQPGPTSTGVPGYVQVEQAALRGCGVIWSFPEFFSGDASNNNMASSIVAGGPFTAEVESTQYEFGAVWERPSALKVLDLATAAGLLTRAEREELDVEVTEPAVVSPQPDKDTQTLTQQLQAKIVCLDTVRQKLGYDPQHEAEGVKKDGASAQPAPPGPPDPKAEPPASSGDAGGDEQFAESVVTGEEFDRLDEADRSNLVLKDVTYTRGGKQYTRKQLVRAAPPAGDKKQAKADARAATRAEVTAALADPSKLTHADVPALGLALASLTAEELKPIRQKLKTRAGRKQEVIDALVAWARDRIPPPPDGTPKSPTVSRPARPETFAPAELGEPKADPKANAPSPDLPGETRPALSPDERAAVKTYTGAAYGEINADLRGKKAAWSDPAHQETHERLQSAFAKSPVLAEPVEVYRGVDLSQMPNNRRQQFVASVKRLGGTVTLAGYTSTTTDAADGYAAGSDVRVTIKARHGLDVKPYSAKPQERELLLNHGGKFKVVGYELVGKQHRVTLEQVV